MATHQSRHILTILAARNLPILANFYLRAFAWVATVDTRTYVEFELPGGQRIGIYDRVGFGANLGETPADVPEGAIRPFELYLQVMDVASAAEALVDAGARLLSSPKMRDWGDEVAYLADPEGNVLALAAVKNVKKPIGDYSRDEFVRRVSDVLLRSGVDDAEQLVRDLENSVHFPLLAQCGLESSMYRSRCVLLPNHEGYHQDAAGSKWTRF